LQWIYENHSRLNIRVVNLSLNTTTEQSYNVSPLDAACEILWFNGIVVVASAGNRTPVSNSSYNTANASPANDPFIITVGASDEKGTSNRADDAIGSYSSSGITSNGFAKPDIIAPGSNIYSVLSKSSSWSTDYPARLDSTGEYFRLSGTSMAAPMVTGAVALLLQDEPNLTPDQVKYRLTHTGSTLGGYPYLDVYAVVTGTTTQSANTGLYASQLLSSGSEPIAWNSVGWNSVGWNSVGWNSVGWNSVGWNSVGWNSTFWGQ
jgi:serine protease AprX